MINGLTRSVADYVGMLVQEREKRPAERLYESTKDAMLEMVADASAILDFIRWAQKEAKKELFANFSCEVRNYFYSVGALVQCFQLMSVGVKHESLADNMGVATNLEAAAKEMYGAHRKQP